MRRAILSFALALLVTLLGALVPSPNASAAAPASPTVQTFGYDGQSHAALPTGTTTERGPPAFAYSRSPNTAATIDVSIPGLDIRKLKYNP